MISNVVYAAMKLNPKAAAIVSHPNGFTQAVVIPNREVLFLRPALEPGYVYTFSRKLSELSGFEKLDDGTIVYNKPIEFRIPVYDDLYEIVLELRSRWFATYAELMEERVRAKAKTEDTSESESAETELETETITETKVEESTE
jgi:hypothetical protein